MTPPTVLVTGTGGAAGVAVLQALRATHPTVALDCDPDAVGLALAPAAAVVPRAEDPDFAAALVKVAARHGATALVCTVAEEMAALHDAAPLLAEAGLRTWLPPAETVATCLDKWRFAQACAALGVPVPATGDGSTDGVPGPWVVKPRFGRGSRDVHHADTTVDLGYALTHVPAPLVQTRLTGREFTVDALVGHDGALAGAVPRWRLETKAGISTKATTFEHPELVADVAALLRGLALTGPANVQGFLDNRGWAFTEVNPRFSGGLPLSLAAGADLVGEYLRGLTGLPLRPDRLVARPGVTMLRHFAEVYR